MNGDQPVGICFKDIMVGTIWVSVAVFKCKPLIFFFNILVTDCTYLKFVMTVDGK